MTQMHIELDVQTRLMRAVLWMPDPAAVAPPWPTVLLCPPPAGSAHDYGPLLTELIAVLNDAGLAVAHVEPGSPSAALGEIIDAASAALHQLLVHEDVDSARLGVLGIELGTLVAAALTGRTDRVTRLCLLAPLTAEALLSRIARRDASPPLLQSDSVSELLCRELAELAPLKDVAAHPRPTLILSPAADAVLPRAQAHAYLDALTAVKPAARLELLARADHTCTDPEARGVCAARIRDFFSPMRKEPRSEPPSA